MISAITYNTALQISDLRPGIFPTSVSRMMPMASIGIIARGVGLASSIIPSMSRRRFTNVQPKQCLSVIEQS